MILEVIRGFSVTNRLVYPVTRYDICTTCSNSITNTNPNSYLGFNHGLAKLIKDAMFVRVREK